MTALLDPEKPLTTHFGCIVGLRALGPLVVGALLVDAVPVYMPLLQRRLQDRDLHVQADAVRVDSALLVRCWPAGRLSVSRAALFAKHICSSCVCVCVCVAFVSRCYCSRCRCLVCLV